MLFKKTLLKSFLNYYKIMGQTDIFYITSWYKLTKWKL